MIFPIGYIATCKNCHHLISYQGNFPIYDQKDDLQWRAVEPIPSIFEEDDGIRFVWVCQGYDGHYTLGAKHEADVFVELAKNRQRTKDKQRQSISKGFHDGSEDERERGVHGG